MWLLTVQELTLVIKLRYGLCNTILGRKGCTQHLFCSFLSPVYNIGVNKANWLLEYDSSPLSAIHSWLKSREICKCPLGPGCLISGTPGQSNNMDQANRQWFESSSDWTKDNGFNRLKPTKIDLCVLKIVVLATSALHRFTQYKHWQMNKREIKILLKN